MSNFCSHCGTAVSPKAVACPKCGEPIASAKTARKSKAVTVILGLIFGAFGAHRFYLRDYGVAVFILVACLVATFDPSGVLLTLAGFLVLVDVIVLLFRGRQYYIAKAQK